MENNGMPAAALTHTSSELRAPQQQLISDDDFLRRAITHRMQELHSDVSPRADKERSLLGCIGRPSVRSLSFVHSLATILQQGPAAQPSDAGPSGYLSCVADVDGAVREAASILSEGRALAPPRQLEGVPDASPPAWRPYWDGPAAEATTVVRRLLLSRLRRRIGAIIEQARYRAQADRISASPSLPQRAQTAAGATPARSEPSSSELLTARYLPPYRGTTSAGRLLRGPQPKQQLAAFEARCLEEAASDYKDWWSLIRPDLGHGPDAWDVRPPGVDVTKDMQPIDLRSGASHGGATADNGGGKGKGKGEGGSSGAAADDGKGMDAPPGNKPRATDWRTAIARAQLSATSPGDVSIWQQLVSGDRVRLRELHPESALAWLRFAVRRRFQRALFSDGDSGSRNNIAGMRVAVGEAVRVCQGLPLLSSEVMVEGGRPLPRVDGEQQGPASSSSDGGRTSDSGSAADASSQGASPGEMPGARPDRATGSLSSSSSRAYRAALQELEMQLPGVRDSNEEAAHLLVAGAREAVWLAPSLKAHAKALDAQHRLGIATEELNACRRNIQAIAVRFRQQAWAKFESDRQAGVMPLQKPRSSVKQAIEVPYNVARILGSPISTGGVEEFVGGVLMSGGNLVAEVLVHGRFQTLNWAPDGRSRGSGSGSVTGSGRGEDSGSGSFVLRQRHLASMRDAAVALASGSAGGGLRDRAAARKASLLAANATAGTSAAAAELSVEAEETSSAVALMRGANLELAKGALEFAAQYGHVPGSSAAVTSAREQRMWVSLVDVHGLRERQIAAARHAEQKARASRARLQLEQVGAAHLIQTQHLVPEQHRQILAWLDARPFREVDIPFLRRIIPRFNPQFAIEFFRTRSTQVVADVEFGTILLEAQIKQEGGAGAVEVEAGAAAGDGGGGAPAEAGHS